ncbi:hypothetical protein ACIQVT_34545 [Streptomyces sp. NPDC100445]|uniref:hypothetical protein n=1 Tax=Streptomyces sp. NPDC100445 TaxID=3366102 RepID=UPI0038041D98
MGLFSRSRSQAATYAQLGDAATPEAHASGAVVDDPRDELPGAAQVAADFPQRGRFAFRMTGQPMSYPNQSGTQDQGAAGTSTVGIHESRGSSDPRRQWNALTQAGYPENPQRTTTSREEYTADPHGPVVNPVSAALTVNKAGSTSNDPAHVAGMPRYLYNRPFDQWAAHHPPELSKLPMPSPLASAPITQTVPTPGGGVSPGGVSGVTTLDPVGVWRNTVRLTPTPYDETAVVGTQVQPVTGRRWRL